MDKKTLVLLVQLGSPKSPSVGDVRAYLKEFLGNPRVVDLPSWLWGPFLRLVVLPLRSPKSARLYQRIWDGAEFPLTKYTDSFARKVDEFCGESLVVRPCYLLSPREPRQGLFHWAQRGEEWAKVLVVPQFPQYSDSTTAVVFDEWERALASREGEGSFEFAIFKDYHRLRSFIDLSAQKIDRAIGEDRKQGRLVDGLVVSFHGLPLKNILQKGDAYYVHCRETFELLRDRVQSLPREKMYCTFQSRFGRGEWLGPATDDFVCKHFSQEEDRRLAVYAPSFVADCLETRDELGRELQHVAGESGGEILLVDCLNDDDSWAKAYAEYLLALAREEGEGQCYPHPDIGDPIVELRAKTRWNPLDARAKSTIKVVFLTLFLDLVGFSIIFPLFPALAKHYLEVEQGHPLQTAFLNCVHWVEELFSLPSSPHTTVVLFGVAMGSLYSLLQFVASPFWGAISDRWGRRKTLLTTSAGLALSYLLWIFSGSFGLLILARALGGAMAGNISVATAAIADVTSPQNRSKGMAFVGVAFALGFILGPAFGGLLGTWDLSASYPDAASSWGINPFSLPALFAFALSLVSFWVLASKFRETLTGSKVGRSSERTANPLALWKGLPNPLVNRVNGAYFLFICIFSGMEFTLTFLAVERLGYSPGENAAMFVFIGLWLALIQGGLVRPWAHRVGERRMACWGLLAVAPGLWVVAFAHSTSALYGGLFLLSVGSAMTIPCLTALVSLLSPEELQGKALGVFRSLGALGRVFGPLLAGLLYWYGGSRGPFLWGGGLLFLPLFLLWRRPAGQIKAPGNAV